MRPFTLAATAMLMLAASAASADILVYPLPGSEMAFVLQGEVTPHPGRTVTFRHPRFGSLYFRLDDVTYYKVPSTRAIANRKLQDAIRGNDVRTCLQAGSWALHHGLLPQFYEAASASWKLDRDNAEVQRLAALKQKLDAPLPASAAQEEEIRKFVPVGGKMRFARSKHFLLMHDTLPTKDPKSKKTRAEERLELLEMVYESFLLKFYLEGYEIPLPQEPLKVVLFAHKQDFLTFCSSIHAELTKSAGFYSRDVNIAVFFDQGTNEIYQLLDGLNTQLQAVKQRAVKVRTAGSADLVRFADTIQLLTAVARENADIEVVSHEATHQLAANTGLMPNDAPVPLWAAEGLATYFEAPKEAAWSGIGAVNKERLEWYRALADDTRHCSIDFVASDRIFTHAGSDASVVAAYGQAWALTHFLMDRHFDKLVQYYQVIAKKPSKEPLSPEEHLKVFEQVFGEKERLNTEWRVYMRSLKTDVDRILEEK